MNEFDQFVKHDLKIKHYARYTDDFVIISDNKEYLEKIIPKLEEFLSERLKLSLHPNKISIIPYGRGVDFLGQIVFPHHRLLRAKTKKRIFRKMKWKVEQYKSGVITEKSLNGSLQSYLGVLSHADTYEVSENLKNQFWFWTTDMH